MRLRAPQVLNRARILAPVDTGRLRASGKIKYSGLFSFRAKATVVFDVDYAQAVHDGRRRTIIRAKPGGVLRFVVGGQVVYAKWVDQPARPGKPFLDRALREIVGGRGWSVTNG